MKTQLIMLDIPIIVSDEKIKVGDLYLTSDHRIVQWSKEFEEEWGDDIAFLPKPIIAGIEGLPSIDWNGLEEEFGWVDVEKLSKVDIKFHHKNIQEREIDYILGYEDGFKKAQSLNEKKFSLDDMQIALRKLSQSYDKGYSRELDVDFQEADSIIKSLQQQPKVFDIEVESEEKVKWVRNTNRNIPTKDDLDRVQVLKITRKNYLNQR